MVITKPVVIHLDNKADVFEAGNRLTLSPEGQTVTEDVEIILDGKRYFLEVGDKIIITEQLYGFPVLPGDTPADKLIKYVQDNWLDWDMQNPTFRQAAQQFGIHPAELNDLFSIQRHIQMSSQDPGLKKHLTSLSATQMGTAQAAADEFGDEEEEDGSPSDEEEDGSPSDGSASDTQPVTTAMTAQAPVSPTNAPAPASPADSPVDVGESPIDTNPGPVGPATSSPSDSPTDSPSDSPIDQATIDRVQKTRLPPP